MLQVTLKRGNCTWIILEVVIGVAMIGQEVESYVEEVI